MNPNQSLAALKHGRKVREEEVAEKIAGNLQDGNHIYPACSNCNAILMDIWRTRPHETETWKIRATCPFCGDSSFVIEVQGGFHIGGYGEIKEDDAEDDIPSTVVEEFQCDGDTFNFTIKKANPDAKPLTR